MFQKSHYGKDVVVLSRTRNQESKKAREIALAVEKLVSEYEQEILAREKSKSKKTQKNRAQRKRRKERIAHAKEEKKGVKVPIPLQSLPPPVIPFPPPSSSLSLSSTPASGPGPGAPIHSKSNFSNAPISGNGKKGGRKPFKPLIEHKHNKHSKRTDSISSSDAEAESDSPLTDSNASSESSFFSNYEDSDSKERPSSSSKSSKTVKALATNLQMSHADGGTKSLQKEKSVSVQHRSDDVRTAEKADTASSERESTVKKGNSSSHSSPNAVQQKSKKLSNKK